MLIAEPSHNRGLLISNDEQNDLLSMSSHKTEGSVVRKSIVIKQRKSNSPQLNQRNSAVQHETANRSVPKMTLSCIQ